MIQWPESGITPSRTLLAAKCMIFAMVVPNDFSPPIASTGMGSLPLAKNCWLSMASWSNGANCMKADVLDGLPERNQAAVAELVSRVIVAKASLKISINSAQFAEVSNKPRNSSRKDIGAEFSIEVPYLGTNRADATRLLIEGVGGNRPDPVVVKALARSRAWFDDLATGKAQSMAEIAARENITDNYVGNLIHLAWLAPNTNSTSE
jgi:hypothetical protein